MKRKSIKMEVDRWLTAWEWWRTVCSQTLVFRVSAMMEQWRSISTDNPRSRKNKQRWWLVAIVEDEKKGNQDVKCNKDHHITDITFSSSLLSLLSPQARSAAASAIEPHTTEEIGCWKMPLYFFLLSYSCRLRTKDSPLLSRISITLIFGVSLNSVLWRLGKEITDRLVHFSYGFLLAYPVREIPCESRHV